MIDQSKDLYIFEDNQKITDKTFISEFSDFLLSVDKSFKKNDEWSINFVGIMIIVHKGRFVKFFSFPKHYAVKLENDVKTPITMITDEEILNNEIKKVVQSIIKASTASINVLNNDSDQNVASVLYSLMQVINHYQNYGLYIEVEKQYKTQYTGNINFEKTISKFTPLKSGNNFVYDKHVVTKKNSYNTFLTDVMVYVINQGTREFNFYFDEINIKQSCDESIFHDKPFVINELYKLLKITYKDIYKKLIKNLISYFSMEQVKLASGYTIATSNFELVWEAMIGSTLGEGFEKKRFYIEDDKTGTGKTIEVDHFNEVDKKIYDSKYYFEIKNVDYKQLFYNYHIVSEKLADGDTYLEIKNIYGTYNNALITPRDVSKGSETYLIERKSLDNVDIKIYFFYINEIIHRYVLGSGQIEMWDEFIKSNNVD